MLLYLSAFETLFFLPIVWTLVFFWTAYFITRKGSSTKLLTKTTKLKVKAKKLYRRIYTHVILQLGFYPYVMAGVYWMLFKGYEGIYVYNHIMLTNATFVYFLLLIFFGFIVWAWLCLHYRGVQINETSLDYLFSLLHLFFYMPFLILANTLLGLFFFLELSSSLVLLSFASLQSLGQRHNTKGDAPQAQYFFNLVFYQFWSSFFSSILILYSIINFYFLFGTTEWVYLELLMTSQSWSHANWLIIYLTNIILLLGVFIKLGVGPFFAYKLELYQGLPIYALCFYSLIYFFLFLSIFFIVFGYYFTTSLPLLRPISSFALLGIFLFFGFFLFDSTLLRQFFALSSLITTINLVSILL